MERTIPPHFLRFARTIAIAATALAGGCAGSVTPGDGATQDGQVADASDSAVSDGDPCASPGPLGAPCASPGLTCGSSCGAWHCGPSANGTNQWDRLLCGGPCMPPEATA